MLPRRAAAARHWGPPSPCAVSAEGMIAHGLTTAPIRSGRRRPATVSPIPEEPLETPWQDCARGRRSFPTPFGLGGRRSLTAPHHVARRRTFRHAAVVTSPTIRGEQARAIVTTVASRSARTY